MSNKQFFIIKELVHLRTNCFETKKLNIVSAIIDLVQRDFSEPYNIYTYRTDIFA